MRRKDFSKPDEVIESRSFSALFKNNGKFRGRSFFKLIKNWKYIIGKDLKGKVYIKKLQNDILFLTVPDSMWLQNMMFMRNTIKKKVNEIDKNIKEIRFEVEKSKKRDWKDTNSIDISGMNVDNEKIMSFEERLEKIEDPVLKEKLRHLYIKKEKFRAYSLSAGFKICKKCKSVYNDKICPYCGE